MNSLFEVLSISKQSFHQMLSRRKYKYEEQEQLKKKVERMERLLEAKEKARQASTPPVRSRTRSVEERLTELKTLYDKGIISEEVYHGKMKSILEDL